MPKTCPFSSNNNSEVRYNNYLQLDKILTAQRPLSNLDGEYLFILVHQVKELWMDFINKEIFFIKRELDISTSSIKGICERISRITLIFNQLISAWDVLNTLDLAQYKSFRDNLGNASGIQSLNFRLFEFLLGNRDKEDLKYSNDIELEKLEEEATKPSVYDEIIQKLLSPIFSIDSEVIDRDYCKKHNKNLSVSNAWKSIFENKDKYGDLFLLGKSLILLEEKIIMWKSKHIEIAKKYIEKQKGTGETEGVEYLKQKRGYSFFPELMKLKAFI